MESIKIENLTFTYPQSTVPTLDNICLSVKEGEFVTICGKSGCGKSTLLRQLKPTIAPHGTLSGEIYFEGRAIGELSQRDEAEKIGFVFQDPDSQIVTDKVWHELAFGLESLGVPKSELRGRVAEMASFFGIGGWFHKKVTELSGGQKQLLNLASVMVMQPSLLILDEPTSQLDPIAARDFLDAVHRLNDELGITVILTEHRLEEALPLSDRVIVMSDGGIIADDVPERVGEVLYKRDDDMFFALPTPMQVYYSKENDLPCPVTIREGRDWLGQMPIDESVSFEDRKRAATDYAVTLSEVRFRYERNAPDVLKGLTMSVGEGELYAIVGGNGSGKTTTLSVIAGLEKCYSGKIKIKGDKSVVALPQNPRSLFLKKTVEEDLGEILDHKKMTESERYDKIRSVAEFCELSGLMGRHPYDLSGGEMQRVALAKVLLTKPDILLLDEPTKGLDAHFKSKLGSMLRGLCRGGMTVIIVSHDIEFCARFSGRCGMLFDGAITDEATPRKFFAGKSFYTTSANRMARGIVEDAVLSEDLISAIGGRPKQIERTEHIWPTEQRDVGEGKSKTVRKLTKKNIFFGTVFALLFFLVQTLAVGRYDGWIDYTAQVACIALAGLALINFVPRRDYSDMQPTPTGSRVSKRTRVSAWLILLLIPLTILWGVYYLGDRKYYFISLLIILETMIPFALVFEGRKPKARELVIISVMCALAVAGRSAFYALPHFKPMVAIIIISGVTLGGEAGFLVGAVTGFVSNFFFGQTPYTPWQMFALGLIGFLAGVLFRKGFIGKRRTELCIFGFIATFFIYGGIMNVSAVIISQPLPAREMFISAFALGLPLDLVHAISTVFFLYFIAEPMIEKLDRVKLKYGLIE